MINITKADVELWIKSVATGEFHYKNVCGIHEKLDIRLDGRLRKIMHDLTVVGVCESVGRHDGYYRAVDDSANPMDFSEIEEHKEFPVILPFDLRKYVFIYPKTVTIVAGAKSAGKTGFLYRTASLNLGKVNIKLLSKMEGGKGMMYDRFKSMGIDLSSQPKFIYPVSENYHDYIKEPNTLYVIDYIDVPEGEEFYKVGGLISKIEKKLDGSHAVIGLQKPYGRDIAFGGEGTLKEATLYLAMNTGKLKIVDAKVPADPKVLPKNMQWTFQYDDAGTNFLNIQRFYGD